MKSQFQNAAVSKKRQMSDFRISRFPTSFGVALLGASLCLLLGGCGRKSDANAELQKAVNALDQATPAPTQAPAPAQTAVAPQPVPTPPPAASPAREMQQALAAYKGGDLQDAVTRLQKLRAAPAITSQQRIALNDAMAAVMTEIYALAAKGDARAIQAVKQYEQLQTQGR